MGGSSNDHKIVTTSQLFIFKWRFRCRRCCLSSLLGSLRNYDDDGSKNVTNLHIWQWETTVLHALHVQFSFLDISQMVSFLSTTWNDLFCICVDDVSIWPQMFNFVFLYLKRWFQFNSRIVGTHFASVMTLNNWEIIAETRSYIFRWCSRYRRRRVCVNSLLRRERCRRPEDQSRTQSPSAWFWSTCGLPERLWDNGTPFSHKILNGFSKVVK